jgi:hypothetical protein
LKGLVIDLSQLNFLVNLVNDTGSVTFTSMTIGTDGDFLAADFTPSDFNTTGSGTNIIFSSYVLFENMDWVDDASRPMEKEFVLNAVEIADLA